MDAWRWDVWCPVRERQSRGPALRKRPSTGASASSSNPTRRGIVSRTTRSAIGRPLRNVCQQRGHVFDQPALVLVGEPGVQLRQRNPGHFGRPRRRRRTVRRSRRAAGSGGPSCAPACRRRRTRSRSLPSGAITRPRMPVSSDTSRTAVSSGVSPGLDVALRQRPEQPPAPVEPPDERGLRPGRAPVDDETARGRLLDAIQPASPGAGDGRGMTGSYEASDASRVTAHRRYRRPQARLVSLVPRFDLDDADDPAARAISNLLTVPPGGR